MTRHRSKLRSPAEREKARLAAVEAHRRKEGDPTPEQIWGPINPETGLHMGGGLAEQCRDPANRFGKLAGECLQVDVIMLPFGRGKLIGND